MITGVITTSILQRKADRRNIRKITKAPATIQVEIYRETLNDLESYLDTSDLRKLTLRSLRVIRDDILEIIKGIRGLRTTLLPGYVKSLDGALDELRLARDSIQVAFGMLDVMGQFNDSKSRKLLAEMRLARKQIEKAFGLLKSSR